MTRPSLSRQAQRDLREAAGWIARDNRAAANALRAAVAEALGRLGDHPGLGHMRPDAAPAPFRFWRVRGFSYLLVYDATVSPPQILRIVHGARDLPEVLRALGG